jgi:hypothetical protein
MLQTSSSGDIFDVPAMELIAGSRMRPTHCLLIVIEISSIASTSQSTVTATAYKRNETDEWVIQFE